MYSIIFSEKAKNQIKKLEKNIQERILATLERVKIRPHSYLKKLVGDPGFRLRVGDYRVIMDVNQGNLLILIIKVEHRKNVYKN